MAVFREVGIVVRPGEPPVARVRVTPGGIRWQPVRCPHCGKVATEAAPGSVIKVECRRCKQVSAVAVAA